MKNHTVNVHMPNNICGYDDFNMLCSDIASIIYDSFDTSGRSDELDSASIPAIPALKCSYAEHMTHSA